MASRDWIDGRYLRQRRNLNATSIALVIYILAGGSVETGAPSQLPGGLMTINLEHPQVVISFIWVSLFYFMWRYWLSSVELREIIMSQRKSAYHWTSYVRNLINKTITEYDLRENVAHGSVEFKAGTWVLKFGKIQKKGGETLEDVPDKKLPFIPFAFYAWEAELKTAWHSVEFSEYYTPFFLAWIAIICSFLKPLI